MFAKCTVNYSSMINLSVKAFYDLMQSTVYTCVQSNQSSYNTAYLNLADNILLFTKENGKVSVEQNPSLAR